MPKKKPAAPTGQVTVAELDALIEKLADCSKRCDAKEDEMKALNKEYASLEGKIAAHMEELNRQKYDSPHGKFQVNEKWRVNMPQTDADKAAFFDHLRERGIFDKLATVNSNSLNALYMRDWEEAKDRGEGMLFNMPGVPAPTRFVKLDFKPNK